MSFESSWERTTLKKAGVSLIDCNHKTPAHADEGYPYIAIPQLKNGHISLDGVRRISEADYLDWTKKLKPQTDDVIVVRRCNSGDSAVVPQGLECAIGQNLVVLRADGSKVTPKYLRWLIRGPDWWEQVSKYINVGAVFDSLKCREIPEFELLIPPLEDQHSIATLLGGIDDRIELLRETNTTLEAIAQALFKSWFVDFDPVHAKQQGHEPEGMDATTAALFPDSLAESELGLMPSSWRIGALGDITETVRKQLSPTELDSNLNYVGLEHMPRQSLSLTNWSNAQGLGSAKAAFSEGDILFGKLRPYFHKVAIAPFDGVCSTDILVCRAKSASYYGVVAMHLFSVALIEYANRLSNGAKMPRITWKDISAYTICVPPISIAEKYIEAVHPLFNRMTANMHQAQSLATLRDTLLPRLISGQLRLPEKNYQ